LFVQYLSFIQDWRFLAVLPIVLALGRCFNTNNGSILIGWNDKQENKMTRKFFRRLINMSLALAVAFTGIASALAADGSLDLIFGTGGKVTTDFGIADDRGNAVAMQSDGKIFLAGNAYNGSTSDFALARYNRDGSLDTAFDTDGKVTTDFGRDRYDYGNAAAIQTDGKLIVAGHSANGSGLFDFALARYNSDGSLDTALDTDGKVTTDFGNHTDDYGYAATIQPDGKIVVAGYGYNDSGSDFALARYNSDGSLNTALDTDGKVTTDFGSIYDFGSSIALQPAGKIIVAGSSLNGNTNFDFALARYDVAASTNEMTVDIKPGRFPNRIELEKNVCKDDDNLYVAILTTSDFDALNVDTSSLKLGDPNLSGTASPLRSRARDVDGDGDMDMVLAFPLCQLVTDEALNKNSAELVLTGKALDGVNITGRDSVKVKIDD
jgi:uncharacterized delta-60 repeat protein